MVRAAARSVAWQAALAVTVLVLLMGVALLTVERHQQRVQAASATRLAWVSADDLTDPPAGVWLVVSTSQGLRRASAHAPSSWADVDPARLPDGPAWATVAGEQVEVFTGNKPIGRLSAVFDGRVDELERQRLLGALLIATLVGVLGALVLGAMIARRAVRPLGDALALQRRFVADASHELRTPLTVLHTRAQLVRRRLRGQVDAVSADELDLLVSDAQVLGDVVGDLLLAAEVGGRQGHGEHVNLVVLAQAVVESMHDLAADKNVELVAEVPSGTVRGAPDEADGVRAPDGTQDGTQDGAEAVDAPDEAQGGAVTVLGAAVAIRRALSSLVDNALAHTAAGGHVRVQVVAEPDVVLVHVVDDGEGLDPATASQLVQRFARGTDADGAGRRFGIGLALVDEVARAHGGALLIEGELGRGARFTLRLPRAGS